MMEEYLKMIAHDSRGLLSGIIGLSSLLADGDVSSKEEIIYLSKKINKSAEQLLSMAESYLLISKNSDIEMEKIPIFILAEEIKSIFAETKSNKKLLVKVKGCLSEVEVLTNKVLFSSILRNLLKNANEASLVVGVVTVNFYEDRGFIFIKITNQGEIPEENRENIFNSFKTTKTKGSGMGLYISKKLISKMNGEISCDTTVSGETSFILKIK